MFSSPSELAAVAAILGKLPSPAEYLTYVAAGYDGIRHLSISQFNEIASFKTLQNKLNPAVNVVTEGKLGEGPNLCRSFWMASQRRTIPSLRSAAFDFLVYHSSSLQYPSRNPIQQSPMT